MPAPVTAESKQGNFSYFAFISYSRKDAKAAAWLQRRLEWFRFPVHLVDRDKAPPHSRYLRPIYRDKTHLENDSAHYWQNIRSAIEGSRYLIVLCSPHSAGSKPVDDEVKHFLATRGDLQSLIPVILSGRVSSGQDDNCLCPELEILGDQIIHRNFPNMAAEGETSEPDAWERGVVGILSYMLGLKREALTDHIRREERRQTARARLIAGTTGVLALLAIAGAIFSVIKTREAERSEAKANEAAKAEETARKEATAKNIEASIKAHGRARQAFLGSNPRAGMAYLFEALSYDPNNRFARIDAGTRLLQLGSVDPVPVFTLGNDGYGIRDAKFSPDGTLIATASDDNTVRFWNAATGESIGEPLQLKNFPNALAFSPDGKRFVTTVDGSIGLWDTTTRKLLLQTRGPTGGVHDAAFSPDGKRLVTWGEENKTARIWDMETGERLGNIIQHQHWIASAVFSPDGNFILTGSVDKTARLWDAASGEPVGEPFSSRGDIVSAMFSPDGKQIVTASQDTTALIWDVPTRKPIGEPLTHDAAVWKAFFSPDGSRVVTASNDQTAKIWNAATGKPVGKPLRHGNLVINASFSPDGTRIVTASNDQTARLWDAMTGQPLAEPFRPGGMVESASFSPDGSRVITVSDNNTVMVWNANGSKAVAREIRHGDSVRTVAFSPDGTQLLTAGDDFTARLWNVESGRQIGPPLIHRGAVLHAIYSPDGKHVATAGNDRTVRIWETSTGVPVGQPLEHPLEVSGLWFSKDSRHLFTLSEKATHRWEVSSGRETRPAVERPSVFSSNAFDPTAARIATTDSKGRTTRIWNAITGEAIGAPLTHQEDVWDPVFSPDGAIIFVPSRDGTVGIWDASTGSPIGEPLKAPAGVSAVAVSPDGKRLLTGHFDCTARLWEFPSRKPIAELLGHEKDLNGFGAIGGASFSPDGLLAVTSGSDGTTRMWEGMTGKPIGDPLSGDAVFNQNATKIVTRGKTAQIHDIADDRLDLAILLPLLQIAAGAEIASDGSLTDLPRARIRTLRAQLLSEAGDSDRREHRLVRWLLAPPATRTLSPFGTFTCDDQIGELADWCASPESSYYKKLSLLPLRSACPIHPLMPFTTALAEDEPVRKSFHIRQGMKRLPDDPNLLLKIAGYLKVLQSPPEALIVADRVLVHTAGNQPALRIKGWALSSLDKNDEAAAIYAQLVSFENPLAEDYQEAGYLASTMNRADLARKYFAEGTARFPRNGMLFIIQGWSLINIHDPEGAFASFEIARSFIPAGRVPFSDHLAGLAISAWLTNRTEEAVADYRTLIQRAPEWARAKTITDQGWPDAEAKPMEAVRTATLLKFPELTPKE